MTPEEAAQAAQNAEAPTTQNSAVPTTADGQVIPQAPDVNDGHRLSHGYQTDLANAMNATDATVVQELLNDARDREQIAKIETKQTRARKWLSSSSTIFIFAAIALSIYAVYHYTHLTVSKEPVISVGVFPSTDIVVSSDVPVTGLTTKLQAQQSETGIALKDTTPYVVALVTPDTHALLSKSELLAYLNATVSEPFAAQFSNIRLGVMSNGGIMRTFVIASVHDPVTATKEFLIAEPTLLQQFAPALGINTANLTPQAGATFTQQYRFNLPIRVLSAPDNTGIAHDILYYGFASESVVVIATDPALIGAVADAIIRQQ